MSIGDVNSNERGSGARFNDGKPDLSLIPAAILSQWAFVVGEGDPFVTHMAHIMDRLSHFEQRAESASRILAMARPHDLRDSANVFTYGTQKYAAWNWAKGMPWSVPNACAKRHWLAAVAGELLDKESKLPHTGHFWCNVIMLVHYEWHYPEGDDRPAAGVLGVGVANDIPF